MGEAGRDFDDPVAFAADGVFEDFGAVDLAEADEPFARDDYELLRLGVVIVVAAGDARFGAGDEDLAEMGGFDEFGEVTSVVGSDLGAVLPACGRHVREVGGIELAIEGNGEVGDLQRFLHLAEELDAAGEVAEGDGVGGYGVGIDEDGGALGPIIHFADEGVDDVVDIDEFQLAFGIGNLNREVIGDIVAEGGDDGVVVGAAPFAEDILESEDGDRRAGFGGKLLEDLFGVALAAAVRVVDGCLNGGAEDDVGLAAGLEDGVDEGLGDVGVVSFEVLRVRGAVDAGEVENDVSLSEVGIQFLDGISDVVLEDLKTDRLGEECDQVCSQKSFGACNQHLPHFFSSPICRQPNESSRA